MHIYFKIRKPHKMDSDEQQEFIVKYVSKLGRFEKLGLVFDKFSEHEHYSTKVKAIKITTAGYKVKPNADFDKIEKQFKLFNLHEYFIILVLL